jgi:hypothetical protein
VAAPGGWPPGGWGQTGGMFERFTDAARDVVTRAQEEARRLGHDYIGTEHLLLALLDRDEAEQDVALAALRACDVERAAVRAKVVEVIGEGTATPPGHIPFTPRAKKVLELGLREALQLGHNCVGAEHLLLALLREGEGVACQVLTDLGVELVQLRSWVRDAVPAGSGQAVGPDLDLLGSEERRASREWAPPWLRPYRDQLLIWLEPGWRLAYRNRPLVAAGLLIALPVLWGWRTRRLAHFETTLRDVVRQLAVIEQQLDDRW